MVGDLNKHIFITFDVDWVDDDILMDTVDLLTQYDCKATFFSTHYSPYIRNLSKSNNFEIGVHPNFNFLLENNSQKGVYEILKNLVGLYDDVFSIRSHSLVNGTSISKYYNKLNIKIESNLYIPFKSIGEMNIWDFWNGVKMAPFLWSDYIDFLQKKEDCLNDILKHNNIVRIVSFHPVHVFINTSDISDYECYKNNKNFKNTSKRGVRDILVDFLIQIREMKIETSQIKELV